MSIKGSTVAHLDVAIANPRSDALAIRALARELPTIGLELAFKIALALLDRDPSCWPRGSARWGARLVLERRLELADAQLTFAALATLSDGPGAPAGAGALASLLQRHRLPSAEQTLDDWLRARGSPGV